MPRARNTPEPKKVAHYDTIDIIGLQIAYDSNMQFSAPATELIYGVTDRDAAGSPIENKTVSIPWGDLPESSRKMLKTLFNKVIAHAEKNGHIGEGTDSNDIP